MGWTEKEGWTVGREAKGKDTYTMEEKISEQKKSDEEFWSCLRADVF